MQILFQCNGVLGPGRWLPGAGQWGYATRLTGAALTVRPAAGIAWQLALFVGGLATGNVFTVAPWVGSGVPGVVRRTLALNVLVPQGAAVQWQVSGGPADQEEWAMEAAVVVTEAPVTTTDAALGVAQFGVNYVDGVSTPVYAYNAASRTWTPTTAAGVLGVGIVNAGPGVSCSIQLTASGRPGMQVLAVAAGQVALGYVIGKGSTRPPVAGPRLDFLINGQRVASLGTDGGLGVVNAQEVAPGDPAWTQDVLQFQFYSGGSLAAVLGPSGLVALAVVEG